MKQLASWVQALLKGAKKTCQERRGFWVFDSFKGSSLQLSLFFSHIRELEAVQSSSLGNASCGLLWCVCLHPILGCKYLHEHTCKKKCR